MKIATRARRIVMVVTAFGIAVGLYTCLNGALVRVQETAQTMALVSDCTHLLPSLSGGVAYAAEKKAKGADIQGAPLDAPLPSDSVPKGAPIDTPTTPQGLTGLPPAANAPAHGEAYPERIPPKSELEKTKDGKYITVTFSHLASYPYITPDPFTGEVKKSDDEKSKNQIPKEIKELANEQVCIFGFMIPVEVDDTGKVLRFVLVRDQLMCCFGVPPMMNGWVGVSMRDQKPTDYAAYEPIAVFGKFDVGEETQDGYVVSLYRVDAERCVMARELLKTEKAPA